MIPKFNVLYLHPKNQLSSTMSKIKNKEIVRRIHNVTMVLILKNGIKGLSMTELAKTVGIAKGTLYKIIGSKEQLTHTTAKHIFEKNSLRILEPLRKYDNPEEATSEMLDNYLNYAIPAQRVLQQQIFKEYPKIEIEIMQKQDAEAKFAIEQYKQWQSEGLLRQDIDIAYCIDSLMTLNTSYIESNYPEEEIIARLRSSFRCMFIGMGIAL